MRKVSVPVETAETTVCAKWSPSEFWRVYEMNSKLYEMNPSSASSGLWWSYDVPLRPPLQSWRTIFLAVRCAASGQPPSVIALAEERDTLFLPRSHKVTHPQVSPHPVTYQSLVTEVKWSQSCSVMCNSATPWTIQSMEFSRSEHWSG